MKLLDPQQVADQEIKEKDEQLERVAKLNEAENKAVARMNAAIKADKDKRAEIEAEQGIYEAKIADLRANLEKQVTSLEKRRADALKPIKELKKEAEILYNKAVKEQGNLASMRESLQEEQERLSEIAEDLADKAGLIEDKWEDVTRRESGIRKAEEKLKITTDRLSQAWKEHHASVHEVNADLKQRELVLKVGMETVATRRAEIEKEQKRLADDRRGIKDGYETLARSIERFNKK